MARTKKNPDLLTSKVKHALNFKLTDKELARRAESMAELDEAIVGLETEFDEVKADWKAKIQLKEEERRKISAIVRAGEERRTVECTEERDYAGNAVRYRFYGKVMEEPAHERR